MELDWNKEALDQLAWHFEEHVRPRLDGLTDDEYLWAPAPPPVTTIAWRLGHVIGGVFGDRNTSHFGAPPVAFGSDGWPPDAATALAALDDGYATWTRGVAALGDDGMRRAVGPAEGPWHESPMGALVMHINREAIHHLAEVLLLRDIYRATSRS